MLRCAQTLEILHTDIKIHQESDIDKAKAHRIINVTFRWNEEKREKTLMEHAVFAPAESREVFDFRDNF